MQATFSFVPTKNNIGLLSFAILACAQRVYTCPSSMCVFVCCLFHLSNSEVFLGSVPFKDSPSPLHHRCKLWNLFQSEALYKWAFQPLLYSSEWDTLSPAERELMWASWKTSLLWMSGVVVTGTTLCFVVQYYVY